MTPDNDPLSPVRLYECGETLRALRSQHYDAGSPRIYLEAELRDYLAGFLGPIRRPLLAGLDGEPSAAPAKE